MWRRQLDGEPLRGLVWRRQLSSEPCPVASVVWQANTQQPTRAGVVPATEQAAASPVVAGRAWQESNAPYTSIRVMRHLGSEPCYRRRGVASKQRTLREQVCDAERI